MVLGQSCALSGPARELGIGMNAGLLARFSAINEKGGIKGRKIRLVSRDDSYEPDHAIRNTRELLNKENVFLLIGFVGTPTSKAVVPIAEDEKAPYVAPFTGAEFLRNPFKRYVVNIRASYYQEMEKLAQYLVDRKKMKKIACFFQNDGYGQAGLNGIKIALSKRNQSLVATGNYERNTLAVKSALLRIKRSEPDAVVMVGAYKPCAEFIRLGKKIGMDDTIFANISFVGAEALADELGDVGNDCCIISQVVPYPQNETSALVQEYKKDMAKYQPNGKISFVSLEGYMAAKFFGMVVENMERIDRESFIDTIEQKKSFDLGGTVLKFDSNDHQGLDRVFLTEIRNGEVKPLEKGEDTGK
jgi:ABC-type branched-subunit amino acid transport system substrate-binding protein